METKNILALAFGILAAVGLTLCARALNKVRREELHGRLGSAHKRKKARLRRRAEAEARRHAPPPAASPKPFFDEEAFLYKEWYQELSPADKRRADADPDWYDRLMERAGTR
jgi:hypothetical protein